MSEIGKAVRIGQITHNPSGRTVVVALDHGPAIGPCEGLMDPVETIEKICSGNPDTLFAHKGIIKKAYPVLIKNRVPFLLSISTATILGPNPERVYLVDSVEYAAQIGASGVSMRIFIGGPFEYEMIQALGKVSAECEKYGLVLMAMVYPKGFKNDFDVKLVQHAARLGAELGADFVKTFYTGDPQSFSEVTASCPAPIVTSGGPKTDTALQYLQTVKGAIDAGAVGVAVGRNVWQHPDPAAMLMAINKIVHDDASPEEVAREIDEKK